MAKKESGAAETAGTVVGGVVDADDNNVSNTRKKKGFSWVFADIYTTVTENFSAVAWGAALAFGGFTLLLYALNIAQLPEFTWSDLTGTLLAMCATGVLVGGLVVAYCLCAGYFARVALESVYPDAVRYAPTSSPNTDAPIPPYVRLIRGPFIVGATCLSILVWVAIAVFGSPEVLIAPYRGHLFVALGIAALAVVVLLLLDWQRFPGQRWRYALLCILGGASVMVVVTITAWSLGPDDLVKRDPVGLPSSSAKASEWTDYSIWALKHVFWIGLVAVVVLMFLLNHRAIVGCAKLRIVKLSTVRMRETWSSWACVLSKRFVLLFGDADDRRLIKAKTLVTVVLWFFAGLVFLMAYAMASVGDAHNSVVNLLFISTALTVLNWASFSIRDWKGRAGLGVMTAVVILMIYPMMARNPIMFPKMVVSMLGLGNERLVSIGLSNKQCATLAPYGVSCESDGEEAITLANVNMLDRVGSSMVLELLIKDEMIDAGKKAKLSDREKSHQAVKTLVATMQMGPGSPSARFCDRLLLSQLSTMSTANAATSNVIDAKALRCVELIVPKEQVLGYTQADRRNYQGDYTSYQPGPEKSPTTVSILTSSSSEKATATEAAVAVALPTK